MKTKINVLSLFDGMSCGQQALERCGIDIENYYASEIDKYAIQVTMANYPNTIQLGSVINVDGYSLPKIDLLMGGSPCQSFSFAGKRKGMATKCETEILTLDHYLELKAEGYEFEGQSYLFWEYMRLLNECKPKYFLLENVEMGEKWEKVLSKAIGLNGIHINSSLVSAQNRKRIYWTNIGMQPSGLFGDLTSIIEQPKDKKILLKDILEMEVDEKYYLSEKMVNCLIKRPKEYDVFKPVELHSESKSKCINARLFKMGSGDNYIKIDKKGNIKDNQDKASCFTAGGHSGGNHSDMDLIVHNTMPRSSTTGKGGTGHLSRNDGKTYCLDTSNTNAVEVVLKKSNVQIEKTIVKNKFYENEVKGLDFYNQSKHDKMPTLANPSHGHLGVFDTSRIRRLTPIECERLQTVADNYTAHVSDSQRYKMLGNGWTIDVIAHILSYMIHDEN
jgi:DNA (cytosine-5)-methyltransferase 3A